MRRFVNYFIVVSASVFFLSLAGLIGLFAYLFSDTCDDTIPTPVTNARGDVAEEQLQVCTGIGTVLNYSVTLQPQGATAAKTLVQYTPQTGEAKLRWTDDDTLMIDLGKVRAIWARVDEVGPIHITYTFTKVE
ncbi:MAG: hypothetical protein WBF43_09755 [Methylocella sp.]